MMMHEEAEAQLHHSQIRQEMEVSAQLQDPAALLPRKNVKIKIYKTVTLPVIMHGIETRPLTP
jgi:hypothetical protein